MAENPKAYDQAFKSLSDADPRGLLDIFGVLPHGVDAEVEPLPRDVAARPRVVDTGYFVRPVRGEAFITIFEALTSWKRDIGERLASYGSAVGDRYRMPVRVYVLPMARHACPAVAPQFGRSRWGDVLTTVRLRWIRPWEIDARTILEKKSPTLDPWAVLFKMTESQMGRVMTRLKTRPDDAALFRMLGGMRYRKNVGEWTALLGRMNRMISREMMRESLAVQEWLSEGRDEEARVALCTVAQARFPGIRIEKEIESISDLKVLNALMAKAAIAPDAATLLAAIKRASQKSKARKS